VENHVQYTENKSGCHETVCNTFTQASKGVNLDNTEDNTV